MAVMLFVAAVGFVAAAGGTFLTGNSPVCAASAGFALLLLILAARNFRVWWQLR
jgi:hypothetical protein